MVFLSHISSDADFSISVDEPLGGPIVITAEGTLDRGAASALIDILDEAIRSGHPFVVDVIDAAYLHDAILAALADTKLRLLDPRASMTVACTEDFASRMADAHIDIRSHPTVARAVTASICGAERMTDDTVRTRPAVLSKECRQALQGTYL